MTSIEQTLSYLQAGFDDLEDYLDSNILYWPLSNHTSIQRLTIGGLLLELSGFQASANTPSQKSKLTQFHHTLDWIKTKRSSAWEGKIKQEKHSRMILWKNYLRDYLDDREVNADAYPEEVKWRVILQLLQENTDNPVENQSGLPELDMMVQSHWLPGDFIWEPHLVTVFPQPEYWFLYGRLSTKGEA